MGSPTLNKSPAQPALRKLLDAVLPTDSDLHAFCTDHFAETARKFGRGMDRTEKTTLLLEREEGAEIVRRLQEQDPVRFQKHRALLEASPAALAFERAPYAEAMKKKYRAPKLESLDQTGSYYREIDLWRVFVWQHVRECQDYLPQVLELPKEHIARLRESGQLDAQLRQAQERDEVAKLRERYAAQPLRGARELIDDLGMRRLVILGDPGAGKSSLMQTLVRRWVDAWEASQTASEDGAKEPAVSPAPIPFLIELGAFARSKGERIRDVFDFCADSDQAAWPIAREALHGLLSAGQATLLLDGLDEVFDPVLRAEIVQGVVRLGQDYPGARVVVTSRVIGYKGEALRHAEFRHFMLQDLDQEQIAQFLDCWHCDTYRPDQASERREKHDRLLAAIAESRAIRELAGNPMLLTMMAIVNRSQHLPRDRAKLYRTCAELLLDRWKIDEALAEDPALREDRSAFDVEEKQNLLRHVARTMQEGPQGLAGNLIEKDALTQVIEDAIAGLVRPPARRVANALVKHLRDRVYILCFLGGDHFGFVHRTFLEFFCADDLRVRFEKKKTLSEDQLIALFADHVGDDTWREVLALLAGLLDSSIVGRIVERLLTIRDEPQARPAVFLAATCLTEVKRKTDLAKQVAETEARLIELVAWDWPYDYDPREDFDEAAEVRRTRLQAILALPPLAIHRSERNAWLKERAQSDPDPTIRTECVRALAKNWPHAPDSFGFLETLAREHFDAAVRRECVRQLATHFHIDANTLPFLKNLASTDTHEWVRAACAEQLATHFHNDADTLPFLKNLATADSDESVRRECVEQLATHFHTDASTLPFLKNLATADSDESVRQECVKQLATFFHTDASTLPFLKNLASTDTHEWVRRECVEQLATHFHTDASTLSFLKDLASNDSDESVRRQCVEQLATHFHPDANTLPLLKNLASTDSDESVRWECVEQLATHFHPDASTLPFLKDLASNDSNESVRWECVQQIATHFHNDASTLPFLKNLASTDSNESVREACAEQLATHFHNDASTLPFLKNLAFTASGEFEGHTYVTQITIHFKSDENTLPFLKNLAASDTALLARTTCLEQLATHFHTDANTLPFLKNLASTDSDEWVRRACAEKLATHFHNDASTLPFLKNLATNDTHSSVRQACIQQLATNFHADANTLPFLLSLAANDSDGWVRKTCVDQLATRFDGDSNTRPLLLGLARTDPHEVVRLACVRQLGSRFSNSPDTLPLLFDLARNDPTEDVRHVCVARVGQRFIRHPDTPAFLKDLARSDSSTRVREACVDLLRNAWGPSAVEGLEPDSEA